MLWQLLVLLAGIKTSPVLWRKNFELLADVSAKKALKEWLPFVGFRSPTSQFHFKRWVNKVPDLSLLVFFFSFFFFKPFVSGQRIVLGHAAVRWSRHLAGVAMAFLSICSRAAEADIAEEAAAGVFLLLLQKRNIGSSQDWLSKDLGKECQIW